MVEYSLEDLKILFEDIERDFYGRMEFKKIQDKILSDRVIRMNYIISKILQIPIEKVHSKSHYNLDLMKNRKLPLNIIRKLKDSKKGNKKNEVYGWLYKKKKLNNIEHFKRKEKYNHKFAHLFHRDHIQPEYRKGQNFQNSLGILRK